MKKLLAILLALSMVLSFAACGKDDSDDKDSKRKKDKSVIENIDKNEKTQKMFYKYIEGHLTYSTNTRNYPTNPEIGVFSAVVNDFDGDKSDEMVTFSLEKDSNDYWSIVLESYTVEDDEVVYGGQCEAVSLTGGGNYQMEICAVLEGNKIRIMKESLNAGGSSYICNYTSYEIQDGSPVKIDEYFMTEYYRYDTYEYKENVSGKTFASSDEFFEAVADAGYERSLHSHISGETPEYDIHGDIDVYDAECFGGDHIFSLLDSVHLLGEERLGYLHDNTGFSVHMAEIKEDENVEESEDDASDSTVEITDEDYHALCELVNYNVIEYDYKSDSAVKDAYSIIMDVYGPYESFYDEETRVDGQDPRGEFPFTYYYKFPAENVDWLLENVYNVSPDHDLIECNGEFTYVYYQDDYYYTCPWEKGFLRGFPEVVETNVNSDGNYGIKLRGEIEAPYYEYIDVVADLKVIDGKKVWSVYKITISSSNDTQDVFIYDGDNNFEDIVKTDPELTTAVYKAYVCGSSGLKTATISVGENGDMVALAVGEKFGKWTLIEINSEYIIFESGEIQKKIEIK